MTDLALYRACISALETLDAVRPQSRVGHLIGELRERVAREKVNAIHTLNSRARLDIEDEGSEITTNRRQSQ